MKFVGKLSSVDLSNERKDGLNQISFKGLKVAEGLSLSSNEDNKKNCLSAVFTKTIDKPLKLGDTYEVHIIPLEEPVDGSLTEIFSIYQLDKAELSDDEKTCTFTFHDTVGKTGGFFVLNALVDLADYKTGDKIGLYVRV